MNTLALHTISQTVSFLVFQRLSNQEPEERLSTVQNIVDNDVLGVSGENGTTILEDLLWPINITTPHPLQVLSTPPQSDLLMQRFLN